MFDGGLFLVLLGIGDVGFETTSTVTGDSTTTEIFYLIGDSDPSTFNENSTWVGWIFIAIGALTSFGFLSGYIGGRY
jgi:hypothetical protein